MTTQPSFLSTVRARLQGWKTTLVSVHAMLGAVIAYAAGEISGPMTCLFVLNGLLGMTIGAKVERVRRGK